MAAFFFIWQIPHFWLIVWKFGDEYVRAGLPSLTQIFSKPQLRRVTFMWILATAFAGSVFALLVPEQIFLPWRLGLLAASAWLVMKGFELLWTRKSLGLPFRRAFMQINIYALLVAVFLSLNGVVRY